MDKEYKTANEYRDRLIQAFKNVDCSNLITLVALPTEKEFQHLEWLLKEHYKKDASQKVIEKIIDEMLNNVVRDEHSKRQNDYCDGYEFALNEFKKKLDLFQ